MPSDAAERVEVHGVGAQRRHADVDGVADVDVVRASAATTRPARSGCRPTARGPRRPAPGTPSGCRRRGRRRRAPRRRTRWSAWFQPGAAAVEALAERDRDHHVRSVPADGAGQVAAQVEAVGEHAVAVAVEELDRRRPRRWRRSPPARRCAPGPSRRAPSSRCRPRRGWRAPRPPSCPGPSSGRWRRRRRTRGRRGGRRRPGTGPSPPAPVRGVMGRRYRRRRAMIRGWTSATA